MSSFRPVLDAQGRIIDLEVDRPGASALRVLGPGGPAREQAVLEPLDRESAQGRGVLPVLLGAGMGHALTLLLEKAAAGDFPAVALVDKHTDLLEAAGVMPHGLNHPRLLHIADSDSEAVLAALSHWQSLHHGLPFLPLAHPFYQRLDRPFYGLLREKLHASLSFDFWGKARQPRFRSAEPRLLLITSRYFLVGEVAGACKRQGIPHRLLTLEDDEMASRDFVATLLREVVEFKPDAVLTLNHLGVDREGLLTALLAKLELPLASWFVDNPHLVLHLYEGLASPWLAIFTWDRDNIPSLRAQGFEHVFHLPLGTDPDRFRPDALPAPDSWRARISFVGNSMVHKVSQRKDRGHFPPALLRNYPQVAAAFSASPERSVQDFILACSAELATAYNNLPDLEAKLAYETMLTWESTRQYRADCVSRLLDFQPLIVGDDGWKTAFAAETRPWRWHNALSYYDDLPRFYPLSDINFNSTSMQMKGAVNQRVFDVPAAGAFVLTDWREQMDELFEPGREIVSYHHPDEVPDLVHHYLAHPADRRRIVQAGRKRVLDCHTWDKRLLSLLATMKQVFGS